MKNTIKQEQGPNLFEVLPGVSNLRKAKKRKASYKTQILFLLGILTMFLPSCSDDDDVTDTGTPTIEFSSAEYKVKVLKEVTLTATVSHAGNPIFSWKQDGIIVSTDTTYVFNAEKTGEYFLTFRVDADNGSLEKQVKVTVSDKLPPEITIGSTFAAYTGKDLEIAPSAVLNNDEATYVWRLNGEVVSETGSYTFYQTEIGTYQLTLKVVNEDGMDLKNILVSVLPAPVPELFFDDGRYRLESGKSAIRRFSVPLGKSLVMAPVISNMSDNTTFEWTVDGVAQSSTTEYLTFTPSAKGTYTVTVTGTDGSATASATASVECVDVEGTYYREVTKSSSAKMNYLYEYVPAPGQFINYQQGTTMEGVRQSLQASLSVGMIGAYGGYFITGFDHSISDEDGADLHIGGNAFQGWSEPGIVWVMQDENGDGQPNDTWYELKGSETGKPETKQRYAITYYKPKAPRENVLWTDNLGRINSVDINGYHMQDYYFPMFITEDSYTLCGTCLASTMTIGDLETSPGYDWGYVDNYGLVPAENALFDISNAIQIDGSAAHLEYIDFVKVHTAMTGKGTAVGEISCEAGTPYDYHIK